MSGLKTTLALAGALLIGWGSQAQTTIGFPDSDPMSGRFINTTIGLKTLGDVPIGGKPLNLSIMVPKSQGNSFIVSIFDGDFSGSWDIVSLPPAGLAGLDRVVYKIYGLFRNCLGIICGLKPIVSHHNRLAMSGISPDRPQGGAS